MDLESLTKEFTDLERKYKGVSEANKTARQVLANRHATEEAVILETMKRKHDEIMAKLDGSEEAETKSFVIVRKTYPETAKNSWEVTLSDKPAKVSEQLGGDSPYTKPAVSLPTIKEALAHGKLFVTAKGLVDENGEMIPAMADVKPDTFKIKVKKE